MTDYLVYKEEIYNPEGGGHAVTQIKYYCDIPAKNVHPWTCDFPNPLFKKIAGMYQKGDTICTIGQSEIRESFTSINLKMPLSDDELRILGKEVLRALGKKKSISED